MPLSAVNPEHYQQLLDIKVERVKSLLSSFDPPMPDIYPSPPLAYRMRAEFRMWHEGNDINYVMFRRDAPKTPVVVTSFPIACDSIQQLMPRLIERLQRHERLKRKLFQVEFLSTLSGEALITLVYHRKLDEDWINAARTLSEILGVQIVGRSRKQKVVLERDYVTEQLQVNNISYSYRQYEQAFTQPNGQVNIHMLEWACQCAESLSNDLLELYCGNGNFTLPLAKHFNRVIATELSKASINAARENISENGVENVEMIRLSAEEVSQAMRGERIFRRLSNMAVPLSDYTFDCVFVDPPRAGLDEETALMVGDFRSILYISCNPETLARDVKRLSATHSIARFALFDQFPYTDHMECGVLLTRR